MLTILTILPLLPILPIIPPLHLLPTHLREGHSTRGDSGCGRSVAAAGYGGDADGRGVRDLQGYQDRHDEQSGMQAHILLRMHQTMVPHVERVLPALSGTNHRIAHGVGQHGDSGAADGGAANGR